MTKFYKYTLFLVVSFILTGCARTILVKTYPVKLKGYNTSIKNLKEITIISPSIDFELIAHIYQRDIKEYQETIRMRHKLQWWQMSERELKNKISEVDNFMKKHKQKFDTYKKAKKQKLIRNALTKIEHKLLKASNQELLVNKLLVDSSSNFEYMIKKELLQLRAFDDSIINKMPKVELELPTVLDDNYFIQNGCCDFTFKDSSKAIMYNNKLLLRQALLNNFRVLPNLIKNLKENKVDIGIIIYLASELQTKTMRFNSSTWMPLSDSMEEIMIHIGVIDVKNEQFLYYSMIKSYGDNILFGGRPERKGTWRYIVKKTLGELIEDIQNRYSQ